ncbi:purine-nucleoside phosphorylase [Enhygromyxa salina]|uniref:Uncharacterized protein n=1 Tax=Enhygromyxa salina TaxID=215803 RepID=A0A2S9YPT7_9BACT|nr:purine-nucleoside phosphorylase [Enhygromyxa salina]PRQ07069.1 hypothetical protein ENSA7_32080 [Enhygromyxa salina]
MYALQLKRKWSSLALFTTLVAASAGCSSGEVEGSGDANETTSDTTADTETQSDSSDTGEPGGRLAWVDEWQTVGAGPADIIELLSIGDRVSSDNFANRGDIEVIYVEGTTEITIEMQRFTIAAAGGAEGAFERMQPWLYAVSIPAPPTTLSPNSACWAAGTTTCYVRAYYDGLLQPLRDGANFRVTIPAGWDGALELVTSDNLQEAEDYPDRSDVVVDGLAGSLSVDLDSGNVAIRVDPQIDHYAGCPNNDECVMQGYAPGCGCAEPTNVSVQNAAGQASNVTVDVGSADHWYSVILENRASLGPGETGCSAGIDCSAFADCQLDPNSAQLSWAERAEINFPGDPAISGAGIRVALISEGCEDVTYVNGPEDYGNPETPVEERGHLEVCVGCL